MTRGLLEEWEHAAGGGGGSGELKLDADQDETREKFRIVKARPAGVLAFAGHLGSGVKGCFWA